MHPFIIDAAIVGIQVPGKQCDGDLPRAYVVVNPKVASKFSENDVIEFARSKMARYKSLDGGVVFVDSIPRNASGKILRRSLAVL